MNSVREEQEERQGRLIERGRSRFAWDRSMLHAIRCDLKRSIGHNPICDMSELLQLGSPNERPRPPRVEELTLRFSEAAVAELEALKTHYPEVKACILPALWLAQREYGGFL